MHEWALAEAIISAVSEIAERENFREVRGVLVRVGELQQIDMDILKFALTQMKTGKLANAEFTVRTVKARFKCKVCGHKWPFREVKVPNGIKESIHFIPEAIHAYARCPRCGSPDFDVASGRGVWITEVRGVK